MTDITKLAKRLRKLSPFIVDDTGEEAADNLESQAKRIAFIEAEKDLYHSNWQAAQARITELEAENIRLKKLLKPIAKAKQHIGSVVPTWIIDSKYVEKIRAALNGDKG